MDDMPEQALAFVRAGEGAALATVVETWGSAPRPVGSQLAIAADGRMLGSVSGGCVEGAVVEEARAAIADGRPRLLTFGVSDDNAFAVGLACGGTIRIMVLPLGQGGLEIGMLEAIVRARAEGRAIAHLTDLTSWAQSLAGPEGDLAGRFRADQSGIEGEVFVHLHNPPLRMAIIGAVHIAQALVPMAQACGYQVVVIDPREAFAAPHRFAAVRLCHDWPDEALQGLALDDRCAVVTLTHDPKLDDPALITALGSGAFYIGCLGSRRTHEKRLERLRAAGFGPEQTARLHAPVGLALGARSPAEIAVSILAQVTEVLRKGGGAR